MKASRFWLCFGLLATAACGTDSKDQDAQDKVPPAPTALPSRAKDTVAGASRLQWTLTNLEQALRKNGLNPRPSNFTICAWIKPHMKSDGNYIFSLDRWNGFKFQLQGGNLPFLTVMTNTGDHDQDDGGISVALDVWSQVIASFTNGTEKFYINGVLIKTAVVTGNPTALISPPNLAIGNELPALAYNFTDPNSPNAYYGGNFFVGAIDDVHLYNTVLTDAQVNSLYTMEAP